MTDKRPALHLASGITSHTDSNRYRSWISAEMELIHIPSVCSEDLIVPLFMAIFKPKLGELVRKSVRRRNGV